MESRARRNTMKTAMKGVGGGGGGGGGGGRGNKRHQLLIEGPLSEAAAAAGDYAATTGTSKNALRERTRVESLRRAYLELQAAIPSVPPNTKLSKLDVLVLATTYISHLSQLLQEDDEAHDYHHHHHHPHHHHQHHDPNNNTTTNTNTTAAISTTTTTSSSDSSNTSKPPILLARHLVPHRACPPAPAADGTSRRTPHQHHHHYHHHHHQKGLLHPVKKWPMRARLYAGVGVPDAAAAASLLTDHSSAPPPPQPHLYSSNSHRTTPSHLHLPTTRQQQQQQQQLQEDASVSGSHPKSQAECHSGIMEGLAADFTAVEDVANKNYAYPSWLGSHQSSYYTGNNYLGAWEAEGVWGPGMTYGGDHVVGQDCHHGDNDAAPPSCSHLLTQPCTATHHHHHHHHHTRWEDRVV